MDHLEAASLGATEKYLLGMLDEAQRDAFEEHFFECLECADDIQAAAGILAEAGALPEATGEAPQTRAATAAVAAAAAATVALAVASAASSRRRFRFPRSGGYAVALGLAASLCLAGYQGFVVIPHLERDVQSAGALQTVPSYFLSSSRSEAPRVVVDPADRSVALTLSRSWDRPFPSYRCELRDSAGQVRLAETVPSRSATDELEILLPVRGLSAGPYVLIVEGVEGGEPGAGPPHGAAPVARYSFHLARERRTSPATR